MLTRNTTTLWLQQARNLSLGAATINTTTANTIQYFLDNIEEAGVQKTMNMQSNLIEALKSIRYTYDCLGDKGHAINIIINECREGRDPLKKLFNDVAVKKNELNRDDCVANGEVPYTNFAEVKKIVQTWADREGWYSECLLNDPNLLYKVCNEYHKGYKTPSAILGRMNSTNVTTSMVENILTRCPDPEITPKSIETTCYMYCLNQPIEKIANHAVLKPNQVNIVLLILKLNISSMQFNKYERLGNRNISCKVHPLLLGLYEVSYI